MFELRVGDRLQVNPATSCHASYTDQASRDHLLCGQLRVAELGGDLRQAARLAGSLGDRSLRAGQYSAALHWTEWSLQVLRASGACPLGQTWPLVQRRFTLRLLLGVLTVEDSLIPTWMSDTRGEAAWFNQFLRMHLLMFNQNFEEALELAAACWTGVMRRDWLVYFVNPYIRLLVAAGEGIAAQQIAHRMLTLSVGLPQHHRQHSLLNCGLACSEEQPEQAVDLLITAQSGLSAPWNLQAALFLISALKKTGQDERASRVAHDVGPYLREMTPEGLSILGFPGSGFASSVSWGEQEPGLHLQFLGRMDATWSGRCLGLRLRFAELLVALSTHPEGMNNEQLALAVYGERGTSTCCKTELSRLKRLIPLESRPYRLAIRVNADFLEVPRLLQQGQLHRALELYRGPLLPASDAPLVRVLREELEEGIRTAVLDFEDFELLWLLGSRLQHDLDVWEAIAVRLPNRDPRRGMTLAHVHSLRRSWAR